MMKFRHIVVFSTMILVSVQSFGQFGLRTTYNVNNTSEWDNFFTSLDSRNSSVFTSSLSFEMDYWLRLPNHRIEFYPYLSYHNATSNVWSGDVLTLDAIPIGLRQIGAGLMSHIYLFDLVGDCECPTFSKQGGLFKKGFFVLGGIGVVRSDKKVTNTYSDANLDFSARLGLGFDIGLTDLVTISPFAQFQYFPSVSWHELGLNFQSNTLHVESSLNQIQLGIRVGFRPDYK